MFILGQFRGSPGKKFCGFIASIRVKQTLQERKESCFIPTVRVKLLKNTLIFRPVLEHQWAHNQAVTSSKETLLSSCTQEEPEELFSNRWLSHTLPQQMVRRLLTHKEEKELTPLPTKCNPDLGGQFPDPTKKTLYDLYFYKAHSFWREFGMNTSKVFTLLIKYTFAPSIWQKSTLSQTFYPIV